MERWDFVLFCVFGSFAFFWEGGGKSEVIWNSLISYEVWKSMLEEVFRKKGIMKSFF